MAILQLFGFLVALLTFAIGLVLVGSIIGALLKTIFNVQHDVSSFLYKNQSLLFLPSYRWFHTLTPMISFGTNISILFLIGLPILGLLNQLSRWAGDQNAVTLREIYQIYQTFFGHLKQIGLRAVLGCLLLITLFAGLAINDYRRFDAGGFVVNDFFSLLEIHYPWSQIKQATVHYEFCGFDRGRTVCLRFTAHPNDGNSHEFLGILLEIGLLNESLQNQALTLAKLFDSQNIPITYFPPSEEQMEFMDHKYSDSQMANFKGFETKLQALTKPKIQ